MTDTATFSGWFEALTGNEPFPWQIRLFEKWFARGEFPSSCDLPTGVGKTSVMAVWLIALALAERGRVPRRLVYVVNRRTVVDQATREAEKLREALKEKTELAELADRLWALRGEPSEDQSPLAISTLRGQFADNGEWYADPARPAIVVGTVDMIGSRLLFGGYRIGFKSRPLHAGFLGQDALLVHDEAHLEPAFQELIENIQKEQSAGERTGDLPWPKLRVMALSATTRNGQAAKDRFALQDEDRQHSEIRRRVAAPKSLRLHPCTDEKKELARQLVEKALAHEGSGASVLIFARLLDDTLEVLASLEKACDGRVASLTGTMRGHERDKLVKQPVFVRFLPPSDRPKKVQPAEGTVYLVCTSAGEMGVNLSADHMVCDLSTFESMAQRLGRVNRFGQRTDTRIDVVHPEKFDEKDKLTPPRQATLELLGKLKGDASPLNLGTLDPKERLAAFAPEPTILPTTDILFDAWALTTIRDKMPGRPELAVYLHGIAEWEPPRTGVAWREEVKVVTKELIERHGERFPQDLLDDYPIKPHELLQDTSERVLKGLEAIAKRLNDDCPLWIVGERNEVELITLRGLLAEDKAARVARIAGRTVLLPPSAGGLTDGGMLVGTSPRADDVADHWRDENREPRRARYFSDDPRPVDVPEGMALIRIIDTKPDADMDEPAEEGAENEEFAEMAEDAPPERGRFWYWYARPRDAEDATRASARPIRWKHHVRDVVERAQRIADALCLPKDLREAVILAAELHDLGKQRALWQRSIGNPHPDGPPWYAKPGKPKDGPRWRPRQLSEYRHEFGSLLDVLDPKHEHLTRLAAFGPDMQDVVLHLIAAHHGYGRPHFPPETTVDPHYPQAASDETAVEAMRRYARLQRRYGRWGLAYLESLLRAADWGASANPSEPDESREEGIAR